jgi:DNA-binding PadR family transcriptional regulator
MRDVAERTAGRLRMSPGTLYGSIKRMLEQGLIEEVRSRPPADEDDERRRYYRLTRTGRRAAEAEAARLQDLLKQARAHGLVPQRG